MSYTVGSGTCWTQSNTSKKYENSPSWSGSSELSVSGWSSSNGSYKVVTDKNADSLTYSIPSGYTECTSSTSGALSHTETGSWSGQTNYHGATKSFSYSVSKTWYYYKKEDEGPKYETLNYYVDVYLQITGGGNFETYLNYSWSAVADADVWNYASSVSADWTVELTLKGASGEDIMDNDMISVSISKSKTSGNGTLTSSKSITDYNIIGNVATYTSTKTVGNIIYTINIHVSTES